MRVALSRDEVPVALALMDSEITLAPTKEDDSRVTVLITSATGSLAILRAENAYQGTYEFQIPSRLFYLFEELLPPGLTLYDVIVRPRLDPVDEGWRERVRASVEGEASNQGIAFASPIYTYHGLNYRSKSEVKVAEVLETVDDLVFWPNCRAMSRGVTQEGDFLVIYKDHTGLLECDGPTHEGRAATDHRRDAYFQRHGIFVKRYLAEDCWKNPQFVVDDFLKLLLKS